MLHVVEQRDIITAEPVDKTDVQALPKKARIAGEQ